MSEDLSEASVEKVMGWLGSHPGEKSWLHPTQVYLDLRDITDREAEVFAFEAINGFFAAHRDDGNGAYCTLVVGEAGGMLSLVTQQGELEGNYRGLLPCVDYHYHYQYRTLCNGAWKPQGKPCAQSESISEAVVKSVRTVIETWRDHARQQVVWRHLPTLERMQAHGPVRRGGVLLIEAEPACWQLYMRLVATPVVL